MIIRLLVTACTLGLLCSPIFAQTLRPLAGYEALAPPPGKGGSALEKADCGNFDATDFELFTPGQIKTLRVAPDTFGLGDDLTVYTCEGCAEATGGTATFANDTLVYRANAGAELAVDTLRLSLCNTAGVCADPITIVALVRRPDQEITLADVTIAARESVTITVPAGGLPGGTTCRSIATCTEDYLGRSQEFFFTDPSNLNVNDFRYRSSGFGGVDEVCVTICNDFGICDTYRTTINVLVTARNLPFFDDFSYDGARPDPERWQDEDVLINRNFAEDPPSIGVATFDGVDFAGQAYPQGSGGRITVVRDYLTSTPLNAAGQTGAALNFYVQPRGLGNRPETQDSFLVQFLTPAGTWRNVYAQAGRRTTESSTVPLPFAGVTIPLADEFLYNGFQFRFASRSSEQGAVDMWHLDYVKLSSVSPALNTNDLTITNPPGVLLRTPFTSLPIRHLRAGGDGLLEDALMVTLQNQSEQGLTVSEASQVFVSDERPFSPNLVQADFTAVFRDIGGSSNEVGGNRRVSGSVALTAFNEGYTQLRNYLFTAVGEEAATKLTLTYDIEVPSQANTFGGGVLLQNDRVSQTTCFDEYMAYDDGTAEMVLEGQEGTTILQRYRAFVDDQVTGIQIRIPRAIGSLGAQDLRLVVYGGEEAPDELLAEYDFDVRYAEDFFRDSLQGFTTYLFPEPLAINQGNFYVGWQQQRASRDIGVGYDRNTPPPANEGYQWFNTGDGWRELSGTLSGAIMVRPLLAGFSGFTTSTDAPTPTDQLLRVYPNPTNGTLHLRPRPGNTELSYRLYHLTGALVAADRVRATLEMGHLPPGVYLLEVTDGSVRSRHKIVRR